MNHQPMSTNSASEHEKLLNNCDKLIHCLQESEQQYRIISNRLREVFKTAREERESDHKLLMKFTNIICDICTKQPHEFSIESKTAQLQIVCNYLMEKLCELHKQLYELRSENLKLQNQSTAQ
jgi:hypothetical protein